MIFGIDLFFKDYLLAVRRIFTFFVMIASFAFFFSACEKTDYQHPLYRKHYEQNKNR